MNKQATSTEPERIRMRIGGTWRDAEKFQDIRDPYRGSVIAYAPVSTQRDCDDALEAARKAKDAMAAMPGLERAELLHRAADIVKARTEDIARDDDDRDRQGLARLARRGAARRRTPAHVRRGSHPHPGRAHPDGRNRHRRRQDRDADALSGGRGRGDHAVQRADQPHRAQARPGAGCGQQPGAEALAEGSAVRAQADRGGDRRRRAGGGRQYPLRRRHRAAARAPTVASISSASPARSRSASGFATRSA